MKICPGALCKISRSKFLLMGHSRFSKQKGLMSMHSFREVTTIHELGPLKDNLVLWVAMNFYLLFDSSTSQHNILPTLRWSALSDVDQEVASTG